MTDFIYSRDLDLSIKSHIDRLGYWLVEGEKIFINKNTALKYLSGTGGNDIRYCVYPDQFERSRWDIEPSIPLTQLYKERAQQLRDNYDYVILTYSGGSDSTCMLDSFIGNGIMPDEVVSFMCMGKDFTNTNTNFNTEITYNQKAVKKYVHDHGIPYSTLDVSSFYEDIFDDPDWIFKMANNKAYINARVHATEHDRFKHIVDSGKTCCIVYGLEKPALSMDDNGNFYSYFLDIPLQQYTKSDMYDPNYVGASMERFFVSGDMPELAIKQSHIVANYFQNHVAEEQLAKIKIGWNWDNAIPYKEICMDLLYSHCFDQRRCFTIGKLVLITGLRDDWLLSLQDHDHRKQDVFRGWKNLSNQIDPRFFNNRHWKFDTQGCISNKYYLNKSIKNKQNQ